MNDPIEEQKALCQKYQASYVSSPAEYKVGIAENIRDGILPINGFRHPIEGDTTGWYIYAGDTPSDNSDYFKPLHVAHVDEWCPQVTKYLGLAPGWRFLIANGYEDVWFDEALLDI